MIPTICNVEYGVEIAACPEEVIIAAVPPSSAAIFAATRSQVGFCSLE